MAVDVIFNLATSPGKELNDRIAVVIDVLRASTTIITALANGCTEVIPVQDVNEASVLARRLGGGFLLGGERQGLRIDGFDLGNSPREYSPEVVGGKKLVITTTNGTRAMRMATGAQQLIVAGFANLLAVSKYLRAQERDVVIICSGREGSFSLEDAVCAGALAKAVDPDTQADAARTALVLHKSAGKNLAAFIASSEHARYLDSIGMSEDVEFCSRTSWTDVIPSLQDGRLLPLKNPAGA